MPDDTAAPAGRDEIIAEIKERIDRARENARESSAIAPNSYGAGYDFGEVAALSHLLEWIQAGGDGT